MPKKLAISPSRPQASPMINEDSKPILKSVSGTGNFKVAQGLLDAIILPEDLDKYSCTTMLDLTNCQDEVIYDFTIIPSFSHYNPILFFLYVTWLNYSFSCSLTLFVWLVRARWSSSTTNLSTKMRKFYLSKMRTKSLSMRRTFLPMR